MMILRHTRNKSYVCDKSFKLSLVQFNERYWADFFSFNPVMYLIYNINGFQIYATNSHTAVIFVLVHYVCDS